MNHYSFKAQVRLRGAKYPEWVEFGVQADSPDVATVLAWEKAKGLKYYGWPVSKVFTVIPIEIRR